MLRPAHRGLAYLDQRALSPNQQNPGSGHSEKAVLFDAHSSRITDDFKERLDKAMEKIIRRKIVRCAFGGGKKGSPSPSQYLWAALYQELQGTGVASMAALKQRVGDGGINLFALWKEKKLSISEHHPFLTSDPLGIENRRPRSLSSALSQPAKIGEAALRGAMVCSNPFHDLRLHSSNTGEKPSLGTLLMIARSLGRHKGNINKADADQLNQLTGQMDEIFSPGDCRIIVEIIHEKRENALRDAYQRHQGDPLCHIRVRRDPEINLDPLSFSAMLKRYRTDNQD